ncbi:MAG: triose-phosphate isomerase [Candidatus Marinimicrobia bacterium]|nr:triose-phosphate isomerase [Candidatus Neomarinimicrobiota bacterium]
MPKKIVAANWKMNKTYQEAEAFVTDFSKKILEIKKTGVILCPPFIALFNIHEKLKNTVAEVGAQNMYFEESGAFTSEISADMLKSVGAKYVILGHSERRHIFGETDQVIRKKIDRALEKGLKPIVCLGELLEERKAGKTLEVVKKQFDAAFDGLSKAEMENCIIAYEPVWAIGTGETATPEQASEVHTEIRKMLIEKFDNKTAENVTIQYGGSVKPSNAKELIESKNIDGFLVGGASLDSNHFSDIVHAVEEYLK